MVLIRAAVQFNHSFEKCVGDTYKKNRSYLVTGIYMGSGLEAVSLRFEHILRGDEETACSWGLHMYTLELPLPNPNRKQLINIIYCNRNSSNFYLY